MTNLKIATNDFEAANLEKAKAELEKLRKRHEKETRKIGENLYEKMKGVTKQELEIEIYERQQVCIRVLG